MSDQTKPALKSLDKTQSDPTLDMVGVPSSSLGEPTTSIPVNGALSRILERYYGTEFSRRYHLKTRKSTPKPKKQCQPGVNRDGGGRILVSKHCLTCTVEFWTRRDKLNQGRGKFCSKKCAGVATSIRQKGWTGEKNNAWKGGVSANPVVYTNRFRKKFPQKARAHRITRKAIESGLLVRGPCATCGFNGKTHGHHEDYKKPLEVIWLCQPCHNAHHAKLRAK